MRGKSKIIQIGNVLKTAFNNPTRGRVYSVNGLAPTIDTCLGGNRQPKIIESYEFKTCEITKE